MRKQTTFWSAVLALMVLPLLQGCSDDVTGPKAWPAEDPTVTDSLAGSGVVGMVTLGPRCPTVEEGQECPGRPYSALLTVRDSDSGEMVTTVVSGENGTFRLELEPGDYILEPESTQLVYEPSARPLPFTVEPGKFTRIDMRFDSGHR